MNSTESTGDTVSIVVKNLLENTRYSYYLIATNPFGSHESTQINICKQLLLPIKIYIIFNFLATAVVQNVTICQLNSTHYFIQCIYLTGADIGCNYTLVAAEGGTKNRTGYISRSDGGIIQVDNIQMYRELVAHDLSDGDLAVKIPLINVMDRCQVSTTTTDGT